MDGDLLARIGYLALLLVAVGGWALAEFRGRMGQALRMAVAWAMLFLGIAAAYGIWTDINLTNRPRAAVSAQGEIVIPMAPDGHYYLTLAVNGVETTFMVDTGATKVLLTNTDAKNAGIDLTNLPFVSTAQTANGPVQVSQVRIGNMSVGPYNDTDVYAWVSTGESDISLLGMNYLSRYQIRIDNGQMTLSR